MKLIQQITDVKNRCLSCKKCSIGGAFLAEAPCNVFSNMNIRGASKHCVMVVGQNPGIQEVLQGRPFVGPSGVFFDKIMLSFAGIQRTSLYVTNVVKCYTPNNRPPSDEEIENCSSFLKEEIEIVSPVAVVTLGNQALRCLTGLQGITKCHGNIIKSPRYCVDVFPLYHPSPYNTNRKDIREQFIQDVVKLGNIVKDIA